MNRCFPIAVVVFFHVLLVSCQAQRGITEEQSVHVDEETVLDSAIWSIYQTTDSVFWFGSNGSGVYRLKDDSLTHFDREDGLADNQIRGIQEDKDGKVYFDTPSGISVFDGAVFHTLRSKDSKEWILNENDLWFKADGNINGVYRYDGKNLHLLSLPEQDLENAYGVPFPERSYSPYGLYSIYKDEEGDMWFGTLSAGVYYFDGYTLHWIAEKELTGLDDGRVPGIRSIIEDKNGDYWLSHSSYRYQVHKENGFSYEKKEGPAGPVQMEFPYYLSAAKDKAGNIWMVTYSEGVYRFDGEKLQHYPVYDGDRKVLLYTIYIDLDDQIWLGSHNAGILKFDDQSFTKVDL